VTLAAVDPETGTVRPLHTYHHAMTPEEFEALTGLPANELIIGPPPKRPASGSTKPS